MLTLLELQAPVRRLTFEQIFPSKEELGRINQKYGAIEGGKRHIGNFARYLEALYQNRKGGQHA
jgi:hypothetical protein